MDWAVAVYPACLPCRVAAVLDLPRVIERVPRNPARRVAWRPLLSGDRRAVRRSADRLEHALPEIGDGLLVARVNLGAFQAEHACVPTIGPDDMLDDLVPVAPAPRGPLRSSAGAPATTPSKIVQAASTIAAS